MKIIDTNAPVSEIVAALSKHGITLGSLELVFENVRQHLNCMRVYDPRKPVDIEFAVDTMGWNPPDIKPQAGERIIVALDNGQIRECRYDGLMFAPLLPGDSATFTTQKMRVLAWSPLNKD